MFLYYTGCRTVEAAWVVQHKAIEEEVNPAYLIDGKYKATMPANHTKTAIVYEWYLPVEANDIVKEILSLGNTGYANYRKLTDGLSDYFDDQILKKAGIPTENNLKLKYNMRSIRKYRATEYVKLLTDYVTMGWAPLPSNPFQHTDLRMTISRYAAAGSDNKVQSQLRCFEKYKDDPKHRKPWMAELQAKKKKHRLM